MTDISDLFAETPEMVGAGDLARLEDAAAHPVAAPSPTVLVTDHWTREQGAKLREEWAAAEGGMRDACALPDAADVATDAFASLYEAAPEPAPAPADERRARYWLDMLERDDYRALHRHTAHHIELARIGAASLAAAYAQYVHAEDQHEAPDGGAPAPDSPQGIAAEARRLRSLRKALAAATEGVHTAEAAAQGLGGAEAGRLAPGELAKVARMAASNTTLRAILEAAGRYRTRARTLQTERLDAPRGIITGVDLSGDLSVALAAEQAAVAGAVPELELLARYRLATRRLLSYRHKDRSPVSAGPIVVTVDESGSMHGEKLIAAKGIAIGMAWIARAQRRPCLLTAFAHKPELRTCVVERGPGQPRTPAEEIAQWCTESLGGGTSPVGPLETVRSAEIWDWQHTTGRVDHIIITDDEMKPDEALCAEYRAWAVRQKVRTYLLAIGAKPGAIAQVATRAWRVSDLSLTQDAVEAILSIGAE
jgi:uncharacterized protein with von Willebrand factor type A (vWA) domain